MAEIATNATPAPKVVRVIMFRNANPTEVTTNGTQEQIALMDVTQDTATNVPHQDNAVVQDLMKNCVCKLRWETNGRSPTVATVVTTDTAISVPPTPEHVQEAKSACANQPTTDTNTPTTTARTDVTMDTAINVRPVPRFVRGTMFAPVAPPAQAINGQATLVLPTNIV